jgi:hypothetical protein
MSIANIACYGEYNNRFNLCSQTVNTTLLTTTKINAPEFANMLTLSALLIHLVAPKIQLDIKGPSLLAVDAEGFIIADTSIKFKRLMHIQDSQINIKNIDAVVIITTLFVMTLVMTLIKLFWNKRYFFLYRLRRVIYYKQYIALKHGTPT